MFAFSFFISFHWFIYLFNLVFFRSFDNIFPSFVNSLDYLLFILAFFIYLIIKSFVCTRTKTSHMTYFIHKNMSFMPL